jgi:hypothetical protein
LSVVREQGIGNREQNQKRPVVRSQESGVRSQESGVRSQESGVRSQLSGVRSQESGVSCQLSGVREEGTGNREQGTGNDGKIDAAENLRSHSMRSQNKLSIYKRVSQENTAIYIQEG